MRNFIVALIASTAAARRYGLDGAPCLIRSENPPAPHVRKAL
jgi:hypothetical protein